MDATPSRRSTAPPASFDIAADHEDVDHEPGRPKKPPTITPRRFKRFFTPRPRNAKHGVRTSREALREITGPVLNRPGIPNKPRSSLRDLEFESPPKKEDASRKRKFSAISTTPSVQSSPTRATGFLYSSQEVPEQEEQGAVRFARALHNSQTVEDDEKEEEEEDEDGEANEEVFACQEPVIKSYHRMSTSASLLSSRITGQRRRKEADDTDLWRTAAADFVCGPEDMHIARNAAGTASLPFCVASCNTNSMIAIGEEHGGIRLIDSALAQKDNFSQPYLIMKPHDNAILDLHFSEDDRLLATASGDQKGQIIDMQTQTTLYCLSGHSSSVKQVKFQPGTGSKVAASCSRDGNIILWDTRCQSFDGPQAFPRTSRRTTALPPPMLGNMRYPTVTNIINDAHQDNAVWSEKHSRYILVPVANRKVSSITSLSFLGPTRPHMLVTASESSAVVRLWDMRTTSQNRQGQTVPVSQTHEPTNHQYKRRFGLTSLVLSTDCARLYTLCRDSTVYTYSTSHLMIGDAPELARKSSRPPFRANPTSNCPTSLGPLYAFRHPSLRISTFYPKLALRRATPSHPELLAVASSNDCVVLFPTDERYMTDSLNLNHATHPDRPPNYPDHTPHYAHGTPLIRGHGKEVTSMAFTTEGSLVSVGDDFSARCWREDRESAAFLRRKGEASGARWKCGWADTRLDYDQPDE